MFAALDDCRLFALGSTPDRDLLDLIQAWYPTCQLQIRSGPLASWLDELFCHPPHGLVLFGDSLTGAECQSVAAWLSRRPKAPVLLITGPRGLIGAEELFAHPALQVLPAPWSAVGLRMLLQKKSAPSTPATPCPSSAVAAVPTLPVVPAPILPSARSFSITPDDQPTTPSGEDHSPRPKFSAEVFESDFLDGLVERFRDPLASLSGYLQLLNGSDGTPDQLVNPALAAAREIESALEVLQLASDSRALHPTRLSGEHLAIEALKEAQRGGSQVQLNLEDDFLVRADGRLVRAALQCARVQLSRFGGSAQAELVLRCAHNTDSASLIWELIEAPQIPNTGAISPPAFLVQLLERFAQLVGATAVLENGPAGVPRKVGLAWPDTATLQPSF
jgi:hypothetical protein